jgi:hypothetical protein
MERPMSLTATATARATDAAGAAQAAENARRAARRKLVHDRRRSDGAAVLGPDVPVLYVGADRARHPVRRGGAYSGSYLGTEPHVVFRFTVDDLVVRAHDSGVTHRQGTGPDLQYVAGFAAHAETHCSGCAERTSTKAALPFGTASLLPDRLAQVTDPAAQKDRVLDQIGAALRETGARCWNCAAATGSECGACHRPW